MGIRKTIEQSANKRKWREKGPVILSEIMILCSSQKGALVIESQKSSKQRNQEQRQSVHKLNKNIQ